MGSVASSKSSIVEVLTPVCQNATVFGNEVVADIIN